jgi:hypothetical protein
LDLNRGAIHQTATVITHATGDSQFDLLQNGNAEIVPRLGMENLDFLLSSLNQLANFSVNFAGNFSLTVDFFHGIPPPDWIPVSTGMTFLFVSYLRRQVSIA